LPIGLWISVVKQSSIWVRVKKFWPWSCWVSHIWLGFELGKFPLKIPNFLIFSLRMEKNSLGQVKDVSASYLLSVKHMIGSGQGPSLLNIGETRHSKLIFFIQPWFFYICIISFILWPNNSYLKNTSLLFFKSIFLHYMEFRDLDRIHPWFHIPQNLDTSIENNLKPLNFCLQSCCFSTHKIDAYLGRSILKFSKTTR